jgi:hypothetical protein
MFRFQLTLDLGIIQGVRQTIKQAPTLMEKRFKAVSDEVQAGVISELKALEPGPAKHPIQWTSEKQRRYVMRKLRKRGQIPYRRSGALVNAWRSRRYTTKAGGFITVTNDSSIYPFVMGDPDRADWQQQFHINTGWPTPARIQEVKTAWTGRGALKVVRAWQEVAGTL